MKRENEKLNLGELSLTLKIIFSIFLAIFFIVITYLTITIVVSISIPFAIVLIACANGITAIGYVIIFTPKEKL